MLVINSVLLALQSEDIAVEQVAARRDLAPGFYKASGFLLSIISSTFKAGISEKHLLTFKYTC